MKKINNAQLAKIHILLNQNGWMQHKKDIVESASNGRTTSSKDLTHGEATMLIQYLAEHNPTERLKSLIFSLAYQAEIIYGSTAEDKKINVAKLDMFLNKSGTVKKNLTDMSYSELLKTQKQFVAIVKSVSKSKSNKEAEKAVFGLLQELDIDHGTITKPVSKKK